jgi:hypothetical protein
MLENRTPYWILHGTFGLAAKELVKASHRAAMRIADQQMSGFRA